MTEQEVLPVGRHNDKEFQDRIKMSFRHNLEKQFRNGLAQGMYAACRVVYDRLIDETKTPEERIAAIIAFCEPVVQNRDAKNRDKPEENIKGGD